MKKILVSLPLIAMMIGCGGGSSNTNLTSTSSNDIQKETTSLSEQSTTARNIAKDNTLHDVVKSFKNYQIKVLTDKTLEKDAVSNDTFAVYGEINGENTAALLKLNSNYPKGTKIVVKVYDRDSKKLVGESKPQVYSAGVVNFGEIELDK